MSGLHHLVAASTRSRSRIALVGAQATADVGRPVWDEGGATPARMQRGGNTSVGKSGVGMQIEGDAGEDHYGWREAGEG
ncbi:hypothetical protein GUJ93_ZPchr0014g47478 [Zizania palustris]|uniref:Uncharacterized protein n=1 Tax=Zizania palustris TaxID=103762 RepID=A0A8J5THB4_ZIZPA|nr:hypothetical protein GUJ93_ZPchr0014g47478 [Zizania palustris]